MILCVQGLRIAQAQADGSATESMSQFSRRAVISALAVASTVAITSWVLRFADSVIQSFLQAGTEITGLEVLISGVASAGFSLLLMTLALIIAFLVLVIQRAVMTAELAVNVAVGPLVATTLSWGDSPVWNTWLREIISLALSYILQTMLLWFLLRKIGTWGASSFDGKLLVLGILILMIKTPSVVRHYTYSSGAGAAMLGGAATVGRMGMTYTLMRTLPRAIFRR